MLLSKLDESNKNNKEAKEIMRGSASICSGSRILFLPPCLSEGAQLFYYISPRFPLPNSIFGPKGAQNAKYKDVVMSWSLTSDDHVSKGRGWRSPPQSGLPHTVWERRPPPFANCSLLRGRRSTGLNRLPPGV